MVDLATFRTFPRASPGRQPEALVIEQDVPVENGTLTDEALPTRFVQELRARRRATRTGMRQSEAWAAPEDVPPPATANPEPADLALAPASAAAFGGAPPVLPSAPAPIFDFLAEPVTPLYAAAPDEAAEDQDAWPFEPPSSLRDREALPIEPPKPLEPAIAAPAAAAVQSSSDATLEAKEAPALAVRQHYSSDPLALDYRLLGLANPVVCTVTGRLGDDTPKPLTIGRTGLYRPDGFRPAPWSGLAYDVSPDGRTGLVLGTRILTARGEIPVEDLVPGDTALALRGPALLPIVWIGRSIANPPPVQIAADAFGPGRPGRTLCVGADHPIFIQSMPVSARDLVNGDTIRILDTEAAELFHIDVGFAEVLLAEGVPLSSGCR